MLKLQNINGRIITVLITVFIAVSVLAVGTYSWFSIAQRMTNEFSYKPYDLRLVKRDAVTGAPIQGVTFELFEEGGTSIGSYTTDQDGIIEIGEYGGGELPLDINKRYYFQEKTAVYGYIIVGNGKTALYYPDGSEIEVTNMPVSSGLSIYKEIGDVDLNGDAYAATDDDNKRPFAFTVNIGEDPDKDYSYKILDASKQPISDYTYNDGTITLSIQGAGSIKSGEKIWLRGGETATFDDVDARTHYSVIEDNYFELNLFDMASETDDYYGCEPESQGETAHTRVIGKGSGWAGYGYNTVGNIHENGSVASFENIRVPDDYDITISSLVVVDRILAHPDDIDPNKGFKVTITIGDDPDQSFYYEVIHIEDTMEVLDDYDYPYEYYRRNDPGVPAPLALQTVGSPVTFQPFTISSNSVGQPKGIVDTARKSKFGLPVSYAFNMPIHYPAEAERWQTKDGSYQQLMFSQPSEDSPNSNVIEVDLHHSSAIIVYGIPVGTKYDVWQVDYTNIDGYMIDSTIKTSGTILPDLEVLEDNETSDPRLLRIRADIYNYFIGYRYKELEIKKNWEHGDNPGTLPTSTTVKVLDKNNPFDSRTLQLTDEGGWILNVSLPKYNTTGEEIKYTVQEELPADYILSELKETEAGFELTNTYAPGVVKPSVRKIVTGNPAVASNFTFGIRVAADKSPPDTPMPTKDTITIKGTGEAMFESIKFDRAGAYTYEIFEEKGTSKDYTYDGTVYIMVVNVVEKDGVCSIASCRYEEKTSGNTVSAPLLFVNDYENKGTATLIVRKEVQGTNIDKEKQFSFTAEIGDEKRLFVLKHGEQRAFADIPIGTPYTVEEDDYYESGYVTIAKESTGTIKEGGVTALFINKLEAQDGYSKLTIEKTVLGEGADKDKAFRFTLILGDKRHAIWLKDGESYNVSKIPVGTKYSVIEDRYEGCETTSNNATGIITAKEIVATFVNTSNGMIEKEKGTLTVSKKVEGTTTNADERFGFTVDIGDVRYNITLADGEQYVFKDIAVGTSYSVRENEVSGYTVKAEGSDGTIVKDGNIASFTNIEANGEGASSLIVTKTVTGNFVDVTKKFRFDVNIGGVSYEIFLKHGESYAFTDIPFGTAYAVKEDDYASQDYVTSSKNATGTIGSSGITATFINKYVGETWPRPDDDAVQISGKKTWVHGSNSSYPSSITVLVMNGDNIVAKKTVTSSDNWQYAFNLPKYASDGSMISYTINEEPIKGYIKTINGYDIENKYDTTTSPQTGDDSVMWIWFIVLLVGIIGLRAAVFYRRRKSDGRGIDTTRNDKG